MAFLLYKERQTTFTKAEETLQYWQGKFGYVLGTVERQPSGFGNWIVTVLFAEESTGRNGLPDYCRIIGKEVVR